ncbi:MAG: tryptophan--tRNA ligase [Thalassolituus sp.]|nr:MAG: tryptophan--tRNA ligase [Oceanobacter sp.]
MSTVDPQRRVVSGMRPTGPVHLGHYHGVLKNWVKLQHEYECFFFVADWHALTTKYQSPDKILPATWDLVIDWLAAGVNPGSANLFIQSRVPEQAELHLLLSMITPLSWLERAPAYKEYLDQHRDGDNASFGVLGYPLLQTADVLAYRAGLVPVGADQAPHVELAREISRRFNHLYGTEQDFASNAEAAVRKLGKKTGKLYSELRLAFTRYGDADALATAQALIREQGSLTLADKERLLGYLEGDSVAILPEPHAVLSASAAKMPGLDGRKMSNAYGNIIPLRAEPDDVARSLRNMPTDPKRVRLSDPGNPDDCPVWQFHLVFTPENEQVAVSEKCRSAGWGCIECKQCVVDRIVTEQAPVRERAKHFEENQDLVHSIVAEGTEKARDAARATLEEVRDAMGLAYR